MINKDFQNGYALGLASNAKIKLVGLAPDPMVTTFGSGKVMSLLSTTASEVDSKNISFSVKGGFDISSFKAHINTSNLIKRVTGTYLQNTGLEVINTGILLRKDYTVEIDFQPISDMVYDFYGCKVSSNNFTISLSAYGEKDADFVQPIYTERGTVRKTYPFSYSMYYSALFGYNSNSWQPSREIKIYSCRTYDANNILIQELIPAISTEEGHENEACMFDTINQKYHYSVTGGAFIYGEDFVWETKKDDILSFSLEKLDTSIFTPRWCSVIEGEKQTKVVHSNNVGDNGEQLGPYAHGEYSIKTIIIPGARQLEVSLKWDMRPNYGDYLYMFKGKGIKKSGNTLEFDDVVEDAGEKTYVIDGDSITFLFSTYSSKTADLNKLGYFATISATSFWKEESTEENYIVTGEEQEICCKIQAPNGYIGEINTEVISVGG